MRACAQLLACTLAACRVTSAAGAFTTAIEMKVKIEAEVKQQALWLQTIYAEAKYQSAASLGKCAYKNMCDESGWTNAASAPQFNDPRTSSCVRKERSQTLSTGNEYLLRPAAVGGRNLNSALGNWATSDALETACTWPEVVMTSAPTKSCIKDTVANPCKLNPTAQDAFLTNTGCVSAADKGKCIVDKTQYGVSWPEGFDDSTSTLANAEICATNLLEPLIKATQDKYAEARWNFLGLQETGLYRNFPAIHQCRNEKMCSGCSDPRFRGWYAAAASGRKDLVLVLDTSGSMNTKERYIHARTAAKWVLNTLTDVDRASIVTYATVAKKFSLTLQTVDKLTRHKMHLFLDSLVSSSMSTNMYAGFESAFQVFKATTSGTGCTKVMLFLTDGINTGADPRALINAQNSGPYGANKVINQEHVRIFTYSFGTDIDPLMKTVACENGGVYKRIQDSQSAQLKEVMAGYYVYLAAGLKKPAAKTASSEVRWVEPFEDGQGTGQLSAACARVYDVAKPAWPLLGVVCQGMSMKDAESYSDWTSVWSGMVNSRKVCPDLTLTWAQLEVLRGADKCAGTATTPTATAPTPTGTGTGTNAGTLTPAAAEEGGLSVGIIVGIAVGIILILVVAVCACKGGKPKQAALPPPDMITGIGNMAPDLYNHPSAPPATNPNANSRAPPSGYGAPPSAMAAPAGFPPAGSAPVPIPMVSAQAMPMAGHRNIPMAQGTAYQP